MQRGNTCAGEHMSSPIFRLLQATPLGALKKNDNREKRRSLMSIERRRLT
jgi:hypothetical protein